MKFETETETQTKSYTNFQSANIPLLMYHVINHMKNYHLLRINASRCLKHLHLCLDHEDNHIMENPIYFIK